MTWRNEITKDQVTKKNVQKPTTTVADLHPPNSTKIAKTNVTEEINQDKTSEDMVQTTTVQKREQAQQTPDVNNTSDDLDDNLDDVVTNVLNDSLRQVRRDIGGRKMTCRNIFHIWKTTGSA